MLLGLDTTLLDLCTRALAFYVWLEEEEISTPQKLPKSPILCASAGLEP